MSTVYLLKNQHDHYLDKAGEWVNGENSKSLYRTAHKDEAINQKLEFSVKNFELRIEVTEVEVSEKGTLKVDIAPPMDNLFDDSNVTKHSKTDDSLPANTDINHDENGVEDASKDTITTNVHNQEEELDVALNPDLVLETQADNLSSPPDTSNTTQLASVSKCLN